MGDDFSSRPRESLTASSFRPAGVVERGE